MVVIAILATAPSRADDVLGADRETPDALVRDWLFQAVRPPTLSLAREEIERARTLAARLSRRFETLDFAAELSELAELSGAVEAWDSASDDDEAVERFYLAARAVKRRIFFRHPAMDFDEILFIDQPYPRFPEDRPWPYDRRGGQVCLHENAHRNGMVAASGGRLRVLEGLEPAARARDIGPKSEGSYWRPDLSFDGRRVLFCFKPEEDKAFHLYEVGVDGRGMAQLTEGDYDDIDPLYLPDGHIMFVTTRCHTYVRCMPHANSYVLARCDGDGGNVYLVSRGNECDWLPALLDDGRVIYSRWEYTDKPLWRVQSLWTTNPDGTNTAVVWGNQSVWPDHLAQPRPIPGSHRIMFTAVGHHDWFSGCIGIVDPRAGRDFPEGLTKVTADIPWPEVGNGPVDPVESSDYRSPGSYDSYQTPFPLTEELFLVSARRGPEDRFRLYAMDLTGNLELIHEGEHNVLHAMPVKPRARPPRQPDRVCWPGTGEDRQQPEPGYLYSVDVLDGVPDLPRELVKYLRVFQQEHTTFSDGGQTMRWGGPCMSIVQEDGAKRIVGTVPVREDGSVSIEVPAGKMLYFQLLDEHHRALQTMRSFTGVMPGETRGCVGCHEMHTTAPKGRPAMSLREPPLRPTPPPWGSETIGYERFVQPVLDRYCVACHQGRDTIESYPPDLRLRPGYAFMKEPYLTLVGPAIWKNPRLADLELPDPETPGFGLAGIFPVETFSADAIVEPFKWYNSPAVTPKAYDAKYATLRPMTTLSYRSRLVDMAIGGEHHGVRVDAVSARRLIAWVDAMGPYRGEEEVRQLPDPVFEGIERLAVRPRLETAPRPPRP